jgi:hypothetical protein
MGARDGGYLNLLVSARSALLLKYLFMAQLFTFFFLALSRPHLRDVNVAETDCRLGWSQMAYLHLAFFLTSAMHIQGETLTARDARIAAS